MQRLPNGEFIALLAMLFATVAFSIDSMLPGLPTIAAELTPDNHNHAQLVLTSFVLGMGIGTFFMGPLSDAFGRKRVLIGSACIYCLAAFACWLAPSLNLLLLARLFGGIGASAARVVTLAMVRDLYRGADMARIMSFAMMIFSVVPAAAPLIGSIFISLSGWRAVFLAFIAFSLTTGVWLGLRQPETLPSEARIPLSPRQLGRSLKEVLSNRIVVTSTAAQALAFGALFSTISSVQQIFEITFKRGETFPFWFMLVAVAAAFSSFLNSRLVGRLGMRYLICATLIIQLGITTLMLILLLSGLLHDDLLFAAFLIWLLNVFLGTGLTMGNLNALAMEPMGRIAGFAASAIGSISTVISVVLAVPIGLAFNGTPLPLMFGYLLLIGLALGLMETMPAAETSSLHRKISK
jgi:DHA1 family bicyclomycin/chloramphenicol resistance-like MFS transporter